MNKIKTILLFPYSAIRFVIEVYKLHKFLNDESSKLFYIECGKDWEGTYTCVYKKHKFLFLNWTSFVEEHVDRHFWERDYSLLDKYHRHFPNQLEVKFLGGRSRFIENK